MSDQAPDAGPADDPAEMGAPSGSNPGSPILDQLYRELAGAHGAQESIEQMDRDALQEISAREDELQAQRAESEAAGDSAMVARVDEQLDDLAEAHQTITERLDDTDAGTDQPEDPHGD